MDQDALLDEEQSSHAYEHTLRVIDAAVTAGSGTTLEVPDSEGEDEGNDEGDRWEELLAGSSSDKEGKPHTAGDAVADSSEGRSRTAAVAHAALQPVGDSETLLNASVTSNGEALHTRVSTREVASSESPDPMNLLTAFSPHAARGPWISQSPPPSPSLRVADILAENQTAAALEAAGLPASPATGPSLSDDHAKSDPQEGDSVVDVRPPPSPSSSRTPDLAGDHAGTAPRAILHEDNEEDDELPSLSQVFQLPPPLRTAVSPTRSDSGGAIRVVPYRNDEALPPRDSVSPPHPSVGSPSSSISCLPSIGHTPPQIRRPLIATSAAESPATSVQTGPDESKRDLSPAIARGAAAHNGDVQDTAAGTDGAHPRRQLRQRTAAQLQPYTTDFLRFAKNATKNQWGDLVTREAVYGANHRAETTEEIRRRLGVLKSRKVDTHGGWLELDDGSKALPPEVEEARLEAELRRRREAVQLTNGTETEAHRAASSSPEIRVRASAASESRRIEKGKGRLLEAGQDRLTGDTPRVAFSKDRPTPSTGSKDRTKRRPSPDAQSEASTSRLTVEASIAKNGDRGSPHHAKRKKRSIGVADERTVSLSATPSSTVRRRKLVIPRSESEPPSSPSQHDAVETERAIRAASSSPVQPSSWSRKRKRPDKPDTVRAIQRAGSVDVDLSHTSPAGSPNGDRFRRFARDLSQSEDGGEEVSGDSLDEQEDRNGSSPDRPNSIPEDRFALKGKRKKAARAMMPAIFFKKAEADLELMREERKRGRVRDTLDNRRSGSSASSGEDDQGRPAGMARVRINKGNANRPIRFLADESTSESDEESALGQGDNDEPSEGEETQLALNAWAALAQSKRSASVERTPAPQARQSGSAGKRYWNGVIDKILMRDKLEREAGAGQGSGHRRKRRKRVRAGARVKSSTTPRTDAAPETGARDSRNRPPRSAGSARGEAGRNRPRQGRLDAYHVPAVHLDDADTLFQALPASAYLQTSAARPKRAPFRRSNNDCARGKITAGRPPPAHAAPTPRLEPQLMESERDIWSDTRAASFSRFSCDFDIQLLPPGLSFRPTTYVAKGFLSELLHLPEARLDGASPECSAPRRRSAAPFGIQLDSGMTLDVLLAMLPRLCDGIYDEATSCAVPNSLTCPSGEALRFCIRYMTEALPQGQRQRGWESLLEELEHLEGRLDAWIASASSTSTGTSVAGLSTKMQALLVFKWAMLEVAYRDYVVSSTQDSVTFEADEASAALLGRLTELVRTLLQVGIHRTTKALKTFLRQVDSAEAGGQNGLEDLTCELWVAILHICSLAGQHSQLTILSHANLWEIIERHFDQDAKDRNLHSILRGEVAGYAAMSLSALSQFSQHGISTSTPRLASHWSLMSATVDFIKPQEYAASYLTMSNTSRTRSSRYIWTLYARCLVLADRWKWPLLEQSKLVGKLFDLLNSRELQDMAIDGEASYPRFLSDFGTGRIGYKVERDDSAFRIFLRILALAAEEAHTNGSKKAKDVLARLSMRVMPMREKLPYPRMGSVVPRQRKHRSILVNHYSLYTLLAAIDPANATKRFPRIQALLEFSDADSTARQECLKAIAYLGIVYRRKELDLSPVLAWFTGIADLLRSQYLAFAKERVSLQVVQQERTANAPPQQQQSRWARQQQQLNKDIEKGKHLSSAEKQQALNKVNREMGEAAVMMGLQLGGIQQIMAASPTQTNQMEPVYPLLDLLRPAWIKNILDSPMALDPVVGSQTLECIRSFLKFRAQAIPRRDKAKTATRESQDEFGEFAFDYDDPTLDAILGVDVDASVPSGGTGNALRTKDAEFAQVIKADLSPAIYHLISNLNMSSLGQAVGVPSIPDREGYIGDLVDVWTECAAVLVENDMREWSYYMAQFGQESWYRIGDAVARYEVGLHFAHGMLIRDSEAYKAFREPCLDVLLRSLITPNLSSTLASYFSQLLNRDPDLLIFQHLPFATTPVLDLFDISEFQLADRRLAVLMAIFRNCKDVILRRYNRPATLVAQDGQAESMEEEREDIEVVLLEQQLDRALIFRLLNDLCCGLRDHLDAFKHRHTADASDDSYALHKLDRYARTCREIVNAMKEALGPGLANERNIPQLRLLAGVMNGASM